MNEQGKKLLNGRYEIIRPIGYGGMAEVFLGKDILLERSVAIKMLRNQFHQEKELLEQFQREAKSAAKLVHPNIINVYDVVSDDSNQYIVMEYVEGVTLKEYISGNKLSLENVLKMSIRLADALQHAHKKNIIHCDIKPQNILLDKDLNPKIADFGIAKIVSNQTMVYSNAVMGSVHYISPEQAEGTQVTACSDVYSLGIVMFEMLTGKVPYTGDSAFAVMRMHTEKEVPQLKDYMENVPAGLQEIIDKALAKKVTERYGDAESFKQDLLALKTSLFPYSKNEYSFGTEAVVSAADATSEKGITDATLIMKPVRMEEDSAGAVIAEVSEIAPPPKKNNYTKMVLLFTAAVVILSLCAHLISTFTNKTDTVPEVINMSVVEAQRILEKEGFKVELEEEYGDPKKFAVGTVMQQTPAAGRKVRRGSVVNLKISKGGELAEIPDLKGLMMIKAEKILTDAGFKIGKIERKKVPTENGGSVLSQNPQAKSKLPKGSAVDLVVNDEIAGDSAKVPSVKGKKLDEVRKVLQGAGFVVGDGHMVKNNSYGRNVVLDLYPGEGVVLEKGRRIDLTVSAGGEQGSEYVEFVIPGNKLTDVQIVAEDSEGRRVVYSAKQMGGVRIRRKIEYSGSCSVQLICDGKTVEEKNL